MTKDSASKRNEELKTSKLFNANGDIYDKPITKQLEILTDRRAQVKVSLIRATAKTQECKSELEFLTSRIRAVNAKINNRKREIAADENRESGKRFMAVAKKYLPRNQYEDLIKTTFGDNDEN